VAEVAACLPLIIPSDPRYVSVAELLEVCDGFLLTGGRPNVHPEEYGEAATEAHGAFDRARDAITLPLVRACIERGQPFLGICRGFQEVNVALGGTLHPEIRDLPGRDNHRMPPDGTPEALYVEGAKGFTLSVQWHPEYNAANDPVSRPLFAAFGDAVRDWAAGQGAPLRRRA
jgi:putative glutamine amidotransferase